ncbi:unnamed protein product [Macrosiphum euphorbiae]|uniref:Trehalase n=1 Tax=Macrosiphum euphorbiae TaxID=13131 RepID=A0AAV0WDS7_9HEMI|nr:unnamed protein product [Macrosiphum euphorbiae]
MLEVFDDSKTFVDMKMNLSSEEIKKKFEEKMESWKYNATIDNVKEFVNTFFDKEGSEFEKWIPTDFISEPKVFNSIKDVQLKNWAKNITTIWLDLGRKIKDDVRSHPEYYSIIYLPNPFIIPGGRFREVYYWDSYWIIRGLLICEMHNTAKGMISNYISMIQTFGHVPNGGRIYYIQRSQPPMTIPMVKSYVESTNDMEFVIEIIQYLEVEFNYWITQHNVTINKYGRNYTLAVYKDNSTGPRPESYREDIKAAENFTTENDKENFYSEIKAAAESGWDFSSRWFILNGTNKGNITHTKTRSIVPVELNALIFWNAKILSDFYRELNNTIKALEYEVIATEWKDAVNAVLWNEEVGAWLDFDLLNQKKRNYFYPTNISPLWTGCYDRNRTDYFVTRILKYLKENEVLTTSGGVPTTLMETDQQWDQSNAWPPLQYIMVMSLQNTDNEDAKVMAAKIASKWLCTNFVAYYGDKKYKMYEKYLVNGDGKKGESSGEYEIQDGFGWTNGIVLEFLQLYKSTASTEEWKITANSCYKEYEKLII